jgi:hypothetical protein
VASLYAPRWSLFFDWVNATIGGSEYPPFTIAEFYVSMLTNVDAAFIGGSTVFPSIPSNTSATFALTQALTEKYATVNWSCVVNASGGPQVHVTPACVSIDALPSCQLSATWHSTSAAVPYSVCRILGPSLCRGFLTTAAGLPGTLVAAFAPNANYTLRPADVPGAQYFEVLC